MTDLLTDAIDSIYGQAETVRNAGGTTGDALQSMVASGGAGPWAAMLAWSDYNHATDAWLPPEKQRQIHDAVSADIEQTYARKTGADGITTEAFKKEHDSRYRKYVIEELMRDPQLRAEYFNTMFGQMPKDEGPVQ